MKQVAESILNFLDGVFMIVWGLNTIEILSVIATGGITGLLNNVQSLMKVLFSLVGLVYTLFRLFKEYDTWKIDKEIKMQDLREKILKNDDLEESNQSK